MSVANSKGGYVKTLEVSRDNSNRSVTMLKDEFLQKTENYTLNVMNFITNTAPPLNTIDEVMFEVFARGDTGETIAQAVAREPAFLTPTNRSFTPAPYRTWMELARQIDNYFKRFTVAFLQLYANQGEDTAYTSFYIKDSGLIKVRLSKEFCGGDVESSFANQGLYKGLYIKVGPATQIKLGLPPYLFQIMGVGDVLYNHTTHPNELLADNGAGVLVFSAHQQIFGPLNQFDEENMFNFLSAFPISNMDERLSLDVYSTFPTNSKISTYDGKEEHEFLLFRFPFIDQHKFTSEISFSYFDNDEMFDEENVVEQNLDVGLTDYCANETETIHQLLLPGTIHGVNLKLMVRYLRDTTVVEKDIDFANGFWYLRLLFVKKET